MWKSVCQSSERLLAAAAALVVFSVSASSQYRTDASYSSLYDSETVAAFKNHIGYVAASSMEGRAPGSEGEKAAAEYVYETLSSYGVDMLCPKDGDTFGIALDGGDTLTSRNVFGFVQGYDKELKDRYIVIGARLGRQDRGPDILWGERECFRSCYDDGAGEDGQHEFDPFPPFSYICRFRSFNYVIFRSLVFYQQIFFGY